MQLDCWFHCQHVPAAEPRLEANISNLQIRARLEVLMAELRPALAKGTEESGSGTHGA
jgi:hypothetical protein